MTTRYTITPATPRQARAIARLIMLAMSPDCCQHFAGPRHTLLDFENTMTHLVAMDHSQYSWRNTLVALADGEVAGICTCYDGAQLHSLRRAFVEAALRDFGQDFSAMEDETAAGELYVDSLAVAPPYRRQGMARSLLQAAIERARQLGIGAVGLLVDKANPTAEHLYTTVGFRYQNDAAWGGHPMRHLQYLLSVD